MKRIKTALFFKFLMPLNFLNVSILYALHKLASSFQFCTNRKLYFTLALSSKFSNSTLNTSIPGKNSLIHVSLGSQKIDQPQGELFSDFFLVVGLRVKI